MRRSVSAKTMKRAAALALALVMAASMTACGNKTQETAEVPENSVFSIDEPVPGDSGETQGETQPEAATEEPSAPETPAEESQPEEPAEAEAPAAGFDIQSAEMRGALYQQFLAGETKVYLDGVRNITSFDPALLGGETEGYTLSELYDALVRCTTESFYGEGEPHLTVSKADLDCGKDGLPELGLFFMVDNSQSEAWNYTLVLVPDEAGALHASVMIEGWSRSTVDLDPAGIICNSGSGGASIHVFDWSFVNADGEYRYLFNVVSEVYPRGIYTMTESTELDYASEGFSEEDWFDVVILTAGTDPEDPYSEENFRTYAVSNGVWKSSFEPCDIFYAEIQDDNSIYEEGNPYHNVFAKTPFPFVRMDEFEDRLGVIKAMQGYSDEQYSTGAYADWQPIELP